MTKKASQGSINQQILSLIQERILSELPGPPLTGQTVDVWVSKNDAGYVSFVAPVLASQYMASERRAVLFVYPLFAILALAAVHFRTTRKPQP